MIKLTFYSIMIGTIISFSHRNAVSQVGTDDEYITRPCRPFKVGSYRMYERTISNENYVSIYKHYVVSNENGIAQEVTKFYLHGKDQEGPSNIDTVTVSEKDCGRLRKVAKGLVINRSKVGNIQKVDTTFTIWTNRFIGEEMVKVKAGEFKASVIESTYELPIGSVNTVISYYTQGIGLVKSISIRKTIVPEYEVTHPTLTESDIKKGLKSLEEGKDISSWLDSLSESSPKQKQKIESTTHLSITTMELVEYKID